MWRSLNLVLRKIKFSKCFYSSPKFLKVALSSIKQEQKKSLKITKPKSMRSSIKSLSFFVIPSPGLLQIKMLWTSKKMISLSKFKQSSLTSILKKYAEITQPLWLQVSIRTPQPDKKLTLNWISLQISLGISLKKKKLHLKKSNKVQEKIWNLVIVTLKAMNTKRRMSMQ